MKRSFLQFLLFSTAFLPITLRAQVNATDSLALLALYNSTDGANWNSTWDLNESVSTWNGVTLTGDRVVEIDLSSQNLTGTIPTSIGDLSALTSLHLGYNSLSGTIPLEVGSLSSLNELGLAGNSLSGAVPVELFDLILLEDLWLDGNELTSLPSGIDNLTLLTHLGLSENPFVSIPSEIGNLTNLRQLFLNLLGLTSLPFDPSGLTQLQQLFIGQNNLSGTIPEGIFDLSNLRGLYIYNNNFSGTLPSEIGQLVNLRTLSISNNSFSGAFPTEISSLVSLTNISAGNNNFTSIPTSLSSLTMLDNVSFSNNDLADLPDLTSFPAETFNFHGNQLEFDDLLSNANALNVYSPQDNLGVMQDIEISSGGSTMLTVSTPDDGSNNYQWYLNNDFSPIDGATSATLTLSHGTDENGNYYCHVTNPTLPELALRSGDFNVSSAFSETDSLALLAIYQNTDGANWTNQWDLNQPVSTWHGVTIENGRVTEIDLSSNNLNGTLPDEIGDLNALTIIELRFNNSLSGSIPVGIGNLTSLTELSCLSCGLTGAVPQELANLTLLEELSLGSNQLTSVPSEIGDLIQLTLLNLSSNPLASIPSEIGGLTNLIELYMAELNMTGTLPFDLNGLTQLQILSLNHNNLNGVIPPSIFGFTDLRSLNISNNDFSGSLPPEVGQLINLESLYIQENSLTGALPTEFQHLVNLNTLLLHRNHFTSIPSSLSSLTGLNTIFIHENDLSDLPDLSALSPSSFIVSENSLEFDDLLPNSSGLTSYSSQANISLDQDFEVPSGGSALLTVSTPDDGTNEYQWYRNSNSFPVAGATSTTLSIEHGINQPGTYYCLVSNPTLPDLELSTGYFNVTFLLSGADSLALVALYNSTDGANWSTTWDLAQPISTWNGVTIEGGRVTAIELVFNNLNGSLPSEIGNLDGLTSLDLSHNNISGSVPTEIENLTDLVELKLNSNQLSGQIPSEFGTLTLLRELEFENNQLTGAVPDISELTELTRINLSDNMLNGELPEFESSPDLVHVYLRNNEFTGRIPATIGNLSNLEFLYLSGNQLTDSIPSSFTNLTNLISLFLEDNLLENMANLSGLTLANFTVQQNNFDFEDLLPNASVVTQYNAQANFGQVEQHDIQGGSSITLQAITPDDGTNAYQWFHNGIEISGALATTLEVDSDFDEPGDYHCEVTNPTLLDLTLRNNNITVSFLLNQTDSLALVALYNSTDGANWSTTWDLQQSVNTWHGVTIANGRVVEIDLSSNNLAGSIPAELSELSMLEVLDLSSNSLNDFPEISGLSNLTALNLTANNLAFDDLLPNSTLVTNYGEQANFGDVLDIRLPESGTAILEAITPDDGTNEYQWFANSVEIANANSSTYEVNVTQSDEGVYYCEVTNPGLPDLTLTRNEINVEFLLNDTDSLALIALYNSTNGANWTNSWELNQPVDQWEGVTVSGGRVTELDLYNNNLTGSIPEELTDLTQLERLDLGFNSLSGSIPVFISTLQNLKNLSLEINQFTGEIPAEYGTMLTLESLSFGDNSLTGGIPSELGNLANLSYLSLRGNNLSGSIPPELFDLTLLEYFYLDGNELTGAIPTQVGNLANLKQLIFNSNELSGPIPTELANLPVLEWIGLRNNELSGTIPASLGSISTLEVLELSGNDLEGDVPAELAGLTSLISLSLAANSFTGLPEFTNSLNLNSFSVYDNSLEFDDLLPSASVLTTYAPQKKLNEEIAIEAFNGELVVMKVSTPDDGTNEYQWYLNHVAIDNETDSTLSIILAPELSGTYYCEVSNPTLPDLLLRRNNIELTPKFSEADSLALLSLYNATDGANWNNTWDLTKPADTWYGLEIANGRVTEIALNSNGLVGSIPTEIGDFTALKELDLTFNNLSGTLPEEVYNLHSLTRLRLSNNKLTGELTPEIGNLQLLEELHLGGNPLTSIAAEVGSLAELTKLDLGYLNLQEGPIPFQFSNLTLLDFLRLAGNKFSGSIDPSIGSLTALRYLDLENNNLSGPIPSQLGELTILQSLFMSHNELSGEIPSTLGNLSQVRVLWVANNNLSGDVPESLANTALESLLIHHNSISGLPDFTSSSLGELLVFNNNLEFDDLIPNASLFRSNSDFRNQAKIGQVQVLNPEEGENVSLIVSTHNDGNNSYQWYKDNDPIDGANSGILTLTYASAAHAGVYHCEVTNPAFPEFSLIRNNIFVGLDITPVNSNDSLALRKLYDATDGDQWFSSSRWAIDEPISQFEGVTVTNERVTELDLFNSGFTDYSSLPVELLLLDSLSFLDLSFNDIRSIPDFSQLKTIDEINVSQNAIPVWDLARIASLDEQGVDLNYANQENLVDQIDRLAEVNEEVVLKATFNKTKLEDDGSNIYQWLHDGEVLSSETDSVLMLTFEDALAGIYACEVSHAAVENVVTKSNEIRLNVVPTNISLSNKSIRENLSVATEIGELSTIDPELDDTHTYQLLGSGDFFIAGNSLRSNVVFDFSERANYFITIKSTDARGLSIERNFTIEILEEEPIVETTIAQFPTNGRAGAVSFTLDENVYIGLGSDADGAYKDFWMYDSAQEAWELIGDFPGEARANSVAFILGGKAYVGLGNGETFSTLFADFYELNPTDNSWSQVSDFGGSARYNAVSFVANELAFVGTGKDAVDETKDFWSYNASADTWTQVADLNASQRHGAFAFSIGQKGYVGGGTYVDDDFFTEVFSDIQEYDPVANTWTEKVFADINLSFINATSTSTENVAYIFYGNKEKIVTYEPESNSIQDLGDAFSLGFDRNNPISFEFDNKIYFGLGSYTTEVFGDPIYPTEFHTVQLPVEVPNVSPSDIFLDNTSVDENIAGGKVGDLYAIDDNVTDTHLFELVAGEGDTDNSSFSIDNSILNYSEAFNFEIQSEYSIRIRATDNLDESFEKAYTITVNDVNEKPTDIQLTNDEVLEKQVVDTFIGTLSTTDDDVADIHTYEVISGADEFSVSENGLYSKVSFDFLEQSSYSVSIQTTDQLGELFQKTFVITILSTNEAPSDIALSNSQISENLGANILVGELSTTDANADDTHTYEVVGNNSSFHLVENQIFASVSFDFETQEDYQVSISSTDQYGASVNKEFTISIIDEEDPLSVSDDLSKSIEVYPNPVRKSFSIEWDSDFRGDAKWNISDATGKTVQQITFSKSQQKQNVSIDIGHLLPGVYFLNINSGKHRVIKSLIKIDN